MESGGEVMKILLEIEPESGTHWAYFA